MNKVKECNCSILIGVECNETVLSLCVLVTKHLEPPFALEPNDYYLFKKCDVRHIRDFFFDVGYIF